MVLYDDADVGCTLMKKLPVDGGGNVLVSHSTYIKLMAERVADIADGASLSIPSWGSLEIYADERGVSDLPLREVLLSQVDGLETEDVKEWNYNLAVRATEQLLNWLEDRQDVDASPPYVDCGVEWVEIYLGNDGQTDTCQARRLRDDLRSIRETVIRECEVSKERAMAIYRNLMRKNLSLSEQWVMEDDPESNSEP